MPDGTAPTLSGTQPILLTILNRLDEAFTLEDRDAVVELLLQAKALAAVSIATKEKDTDEIKSIRECIQDVRIQLFDSMAVIDVARRAISADDDWYLHHALQVGVDRIEGACSALELIVGDVREV